ncbi:MAG: hypothetical protein ACI8PG_005441 [Planctomycetota bacterium]|jgi:hypothetical protein
MLGRCCESLGSCKQVLWIEELCYKISFLPGMQNYKTAPQPLKVGAPFLFRSLVCVLDLGDAIADRDRSRLYHFAVDAAQVQLFADL